MSTPTAAPPVTKPQPPELSRSPVSGILQRCGKPGCVGCMDENEQTTLQRSAVNAGPAQIPPIVHEVLRSPGQPLDPETRAFFEPRFGHDFSQVRVHTDARAAESARAVDALAYTVGRDIVFADRRYAPASGPGRHLLAHELTHVTQQKLGGAETGSEARARTVADHVARGQTVSSAAIGGAPLGVHRAGKEEHGSAPAMSTPKLRLDPDIDKLSLSVLDNFDHNSAALKNEHGPRIADLADRILILLSKMPASTVTLTGHTDLTGGEGYNLQLGQRRAEAIRAALIKAGVPEAGIRTESAGETAPLIKSEAREPRNRRVDVYFQGQPLPPGPRPSSLTPSLHLGSLSTVDLTHPKLTLPDPTPPFLLPDQPNSSSKPLPGPKGIEEPPRPGRVGDLLNAVAHTPDVKKLLDEASSRAKRDFQSLSKGERIALGGVGVAIVAGALGGIASDPVARKNVLDLIDGQTIPVPGVEGVGVQIFTKDHSGAAIQFDLVKIFSGKHEKSSGVLQRQAAGPVPSRTVPSIVHEVLRSGGQPLTPEARVFFEPRFGRDFSQVRIHADAKAAESAQAVHASAYTLGRQIVFGAGRYEPQTHQGRQLLAHELAHVIQQDDAGYRTELEPLIGDPHDVSEGQAEAAAITAIQARAQTPEITSHPLHTSALRKDSTFTLRRQVANQHAIAPTKPPAPSTQNQVAADAIRYLTGLADFIRALTDAVTSPTRTNVRSKLNQQYLQEILRKARSVYEQQLDLLPSDDPLRVSLRNAFLQALGQLRVATHVALDFSVAADPRTGEAERELYAKNLAELIEADQFTSAGFAGTRTFQPAPSFSQLSVAQKKTRLVTDFGLAAVDDRPAAPAQQGAPARSAANWSGPDLDQVKAIFDLLPVRDRAALVGFTLVRDHQGPMINGRILDGWTHTGPDPAHDEPVPPPHGPPHIHFYDDAFAQNKAAVGSPRASGPGGNLVVAHEVGHARIDLAYRRADDAIQTANAQITQANTGLSALNAPLPRVQDRLRQAWSHALTVANTAIKAVNTAVTARPPVAPDQRRDHIRVAKTAVQARNRARMQMIASGLPPDMVRAATALDVAMDALLAASIQAGAAQDQVPTFAALAQRFGFYPFTDYARQGGNSEFFAETYALYITDSNRLNQMSRKLFLWFEAGMPMDPNWNP